MYYKMYYRPVCQVVQWFWLLERVCLSLSLICQPTSEDIKQQNRTEQKISKNFVGKCQKNGQKNNKTKGKSSRQKHETGDRKGKSNDSPDIPDSGVGRHQTSLASQVEGWEQGGWRGNREVGGGG